MAAVVAASPSWRSVAAVCRADSAAGAESGSPVQGGSAASTATAASGCRNAQRVANTAPSDTPPTAIRP